jgi:hypothetical protein
MAWFRLNQYWRTNLNFRLRHGAKSTETFGVKERPGRRVKRTRLSQPGSSNEKSRNS